MNDTGYLPLKPALTYDQQIERLITVHRLTILNKDKALSILKRVNLFRLSGYGIGLKKESNPDEYRDGITLDHIFRLYSFDCEFKNDISYIAQEIEVQLRGQISYCLALKYGPEGYIDPNNFNGKIKQHAGCSVHQTILEAFSEEVKHRKNYPFVKYHLQTYGGHFPIWVAVELMTFGNIAAIFSIMKTEDQKSVCSFYQTYPKYLYSWMLALVEVRNICAHYDRLYNMTLKQTPLLFKENRKYQTTNNRFFPIFLVIKRMLNGDERWKTFLRKIQTTIRKYSDVVELSLMDFPSDWYHVLSEPMYSK